METRASAITTTSRPSRETWRRCSAGSGTSVASPPEATSAGSSRRTSRCASRAWSSGWSCSTRSRPCSPRARGGAARGPDGRRLLHAPGDRRRRPGRGARHPGQASPLRGRDVRAALLGGPRSVYARGRGVHGRAVRRPRSLPGVDRDLRVRGPRSRVVRAAAAAGAERHSHADPLRTRGPRDPKRLPGADGARVPRANGAVRGAGRGPLPAVGASGGAEFGRSLVLPGPSGRIRLAMSQEGTGSKAAEIAAQHVESIVAAAEQSADRLAEGARAEAEKIVAKARKDVERELERARQKAADLNKDARRSASTRIEEAERESEQLREETARQVEARVAAAQEAAAQVLAEAQTLSSGLRQLGSSLQNQGERILRDVQAAHKRMQADLQVSLPEVERAARRTGAAERRPASEPGSKAEATPEEREALERAASELRESPRRPARERGNPFDDLDVPSWVER